MEEVETNLPQTDDSSEDELSINQPHLSSGGRQSQENEDSFNAPLPPLSSTNGGNGQTVRSIEIPRREGGRETRFGRSLSDVYNDDGFLNGWSPQLLDTTNIGYGADTAQSLDTGDSAEDGYFGEKQTQGLELSMDYDVINELTLSIRNTEDLRELHSEDGKRNQLRLERSKVNQPGRTTNSPFVLQIPNHEPWPSKENLIKLGKPSGEAQSHLSDEELFAVDPLQLEPLEEPSSGMGSIKTTAPVNSKKITSLKRSRYGVPYATVPLGITKSLAVASAHATSKRRCGLSKEAIRAIRTAGESFLEQLSVDLKKISMHARKKTVDEADLVTIMRRYIDPSKANCRSYHGRYHRNADLFVDKGIYQ